jgi:hypothetical protein
VQRWDISQGRPEFTFEALYQRLGVPVEKREILKEIHEREILGSYSRLQPAIAVKRCLLATLKEL